MHPHIYPIFAENLCSLIAVTDLIDCGSDAKVCSSVEAIHFAFASKSLKELKCRN
jgi:hypothetical protein